MKLRLALTVAILALVAVPAFSANMIVNGDFETPTIAINNVLPTTSISGWSLLPTPGVSASLLISDVYKEGWVGNNDEIWFETPFGNQHLDLTGAGLVAGAGITQNVSVVGGTTYAIGFSVGNVGFGGNTAYCLVPRVAGVCPNPSTNLVDNYSAAANIQLILGGNNMGTFSNSLLAGSTTRGVNWDRNVSLLWTAPTTGLVSVTFLHQNVGDNYAGLDNVTMDVAAIPEPATVAMLGCGLLALGLLRTKLRKS